MMLRVILLFLLFAGGSWAFITALPHITGKQWVKTGKVITKAIVCSIIAASLLATIAVLQHASN